jgi:pimeloyl-ACP methyl ester carboxylesterase
MLWLLLIPVSFIGLFLVALHLGFKAPRNIETKTPLDSGIKFQEVTIPTADNKSLYGWLLPVNASNETLIILHGWGGNVELMLPIALPFFKAAINILLIDSRAHGKSDSAMFSSLPRFAEDLGKSIDWLKKEYPKKCRKIALLGHSVGAGAGLFETSKRDDINAIISISAFAHANWMMTRYLQSLHLPHFLIYIILRYVQWLIGHSFNSFAPMSTVCKIPIPILIVHGKDDTTIPIDDARAIIKNCPKPHIELFEVDDAGHESVEKFEEHADVLIQFLDKSGFNVYFPQRSAQ